MRGRGLGLAAAMGVLMLAATSVPAQKDDVEGRAMRDEMKRSLNELHLGGTAGQVKSADGADGPPYYVAYKIVDLDRKDAQASFGSLVSSGETHSRSLSVSVRVGSYKFDNSGGAGGAADLSAMLVSLGGGNQLPLDDNYEELRRKIWLATDAAYKRAVEQYSAKKARLESNTVSEQKDSFSQQPARQEQELLPPVDLKLADAEHLVRTASAVFRSVPYVETATAEIEVVNSTERFLNSEGTSYLRQIPDVYFRAGASLENKAGEHFNDSYSAYGRSLNDLPGQAALVLQAQVVADRLSTRLAGKTARRYSGPVLLEGEAAAELFAHHFANSLSSRPAGGGGGGGLNALVTELLTGQAPGGGANTGLLNKIGSRILPSSISVSDNPRLSEAEGQPLLGNYQFDEEGTPSQQTFLIQNGILKTLLTSRTPERGMPASTGNMRAGGVLPGNLLVNATPSVSEGDLKKQLLDLVKSRGLEYGIVITRLYNNVASEATRVYADGHEEVLRDAQVADVNVASFKDILAVSSNRSVFTERTAARSVMSYVVPDLLFEDMTVEHTSTDLLKPPALPSPLASK